MPLLKKKLEFIISDLGDGLHLPPLWQLIYHEAVYANHLLFDPKDLQRLEDDDEQQETALDNSELDELVDNIIGIIHCADLASMKKIILALSIKKKKTLFKLYKNALLSTGFMIKRNLN